MISIDVGKSYICVIQFNNALKAINSTTLPVPEKLFVSEEKIDKEVLKNCLAEALFSMKDKNVTMTFSCLPTMSNDYVIPFDKNPLKMRQMIEAKVYQSLSRDEHIMDYCIVDTFEQEKVQKCSVTTYIYPMQLVTDSYDCIVSLGKKPICFASAQDSALKVAREFVKEKSSIILNVTENNVSLHLINLPSTIVTRTISIAKNSPSDNLDILAGLSMNNAPQNTEAQITDSLLKLLRYQTVKYPNVFIGAVYVTGNAVTETLREYLENQLDNYIKDLPGMTESHLIVGRLNMEKMLAGSVDVKSQNILYALGAVLKDGK